MGINVAITGVNGFIGKHLREALELDGRVDHLYCLTRENWQQEHTRALANADVIFHLAGVTRPEDPADFYAVNYGLTAELCEHLWVFCNGKRPHVVFASSIQATLDNPYGRSKLAAEHALEEYSFMGAVKANIVRLTNVFGPRAKPRYQSVVATFCDQHVRQQPFTIHNPASPVRLAYVGDVVRLFQDLMVTPPVQYVIEEVPELHIHSTTVGQLAEDINEVARLVKEGNTPESGTFMRNLFVTYISYLVEKEITNEVQR